MKERLRIGLLLAAVVLVYGNTLTNQFTMDDGLYVVNNPQVTAPSLHALFSANKAGNVFRPLTFATFAFNWALGGNVPAGYHLVNLLLHAGVTWLLYLLLLTILGASPQAKATAFTAALLYAVHPIHTEAVSSIVGRSELLAAGFLLAAWILHLRDRNVLSLLCFSLALLSKESAAAFLPLVLIGDYATGKWKPRARYAEIIGVTLLYLGVLWETQGGRFGRPSISLIDNPLAQLPAGWRILNALRVAWKYVGLHFYPAVLSCDYSFNQIPVYQDWSHTLPALLAATAALASLIWLAWKRQGTWVLAGGIYLAAFATTANILVPTGTIMGERLAYLPSAGFCLLLALGWSRLRERQQAVAWGVLAVVVAMLSVRTVIRNRDWKDNFTLYSAAVRAAPNSAKMRSNLGGEYMARNELTRAQAEYETALRIAPNYPYALASYGLLELRGKNYQAAGVLLEKALNMSNRSNLNYDSMTVDYAQVLAQDNQIDAALDVLNQEIAEAPRYWRAWSTRAMIQLKRGKIAAAQADAEAALRLNPADPQALEVMRALSTSPSTDGRR